MTAFEQAGGIAKDTGLLVLRIETDEYVFEEYDLE